MSERQRERETETEGERVKERERERERCGTLSHLTQTHYKDGHNLPNTKKLNRKRLT